MSNSAERVRAHRHRRRRGLRCLTVRLSEGEIDTLVATHYLAAAARHDAKAINKPAFFPKTLYKARARIEQAVGKLKRFKRIALRCEKTARNFLTFVQLAAGFILLQSVHTT